jgi:hypothetical protein
LGALSLRSTWISRSKASLSTIPAWRSAILPSLKTGLYDLDLDKQQLLVFDGKAEITNGAKTTTVKGGHELMLQTDSGLKSQKFDRNSAQNDDLYRWSSLRSAYLGEANVDQAGYFANYSWGPWGGPAWVGGWWWDPWFSAFTFIPGDGIFYSPFGWGFYSPFYVYGAPGFGYGYGRFYHHFSADYHNWGPGLTIRPIRAMPLGCTTCPTPQLIISVLVPQRASVVWASTLAHAAS